MSTTLSPEMKTQLALEDAIYQYATQRISWGDEQFRAEGRRFHAACLEDVPADLVDEDAIVLIDRDGGDLYEIEVQVFARKLVPAKDEPEVDPNQLTLSAETGQDPTDGEPA